ncbi:MAG TPA: hypothetical protein VJ063_22000 [Verrucomicrobiae bacterium]|nr:hypothetical protein [Verrucomicrobiae bacterium]
MNRRAYKVLLLVLLAALLAGAGQFQRLVNQERTAPELGLSRVADLGSNAPPVLAFTTVALGGFRGIIASVLWIRANELQNDGKFFEMAQLADWITKLQPTFTQVWIIHAWNMAFNISIKFSDPADRWRWVERGIELLRDSGLRYNPTASLMYRELGWLFQFKMGQNLDDAHRFYKGAWAKEMNALFGGPRPNFEELLHPPTPEAQHRVQLLRDKYKMDLGIMQEVDRLYGPLEWRLPEAHAIYWASVGLKNCKDKDLITLRRVVYQSMLLSVLRGKILYFDTDGSPVTGPNLDRAELANETYLRMSTEDPEQAFAIIMAHRNFLREMVYHLYTYNRLAEAEKWFKQLKDRYPDAVRGDPTMEEFALARFTDNAADLSGDRVTVVLTGLVHQYYVSLALDDDKRAAGFNRMAEHLYNLNEKRIRTRHDPLKTPSLDKIKENWLKEILDPNKELLPIELIARLRTRLNLPVDEKSNNKPANTAEVKP